MPKKTTRGIYKSYFFKDHDPVLDAVDRVYELTGMTRDNGRVRFGEISKRSGVTESTLRNWRTRKTKRPMSAGIEAVLRGLGAQRAVIYKGHTIRYGGTKLTVVPGGRKTANG